MKQLMAALTENNDPPEVLAAIEQLCASIEKHPEKWKRFAAASEQSQDREFLEKLRDCLFDERKFASVLAPKVHARLQALLDLVNAESARAKILLAVAQIDEVLTELLLKRLKPQREGGNFKKDELFRRMGPLDTLSAKIALAYRCGIISEPCADALDVLRDLRNLCAHQLVPIDLANDKIKGQIQSFAEYSRQAFPHAAIPLLLSTQGLPVTDKTLFYCVLDHLCALWGCLETIQQVDDDFGSYRSLKQFEQKLVDSATVKE